MKKAIFDYDENRVCEHCGGQNVHYNCFVEHGSTWVNDDVDCAIWCRDCEMETNMVDPECYQESE